MVEQDIDDLVDEWHQSDGNMTLAEFLGLTHEEYKNWVKTGEVNEGND